MGWTWGRPENPSTALEVQFWKDCRVNCGCIVEVPVTCHPEGDFDLDESHFAVFVKDNQFEEHGASLDIKFLGELTNGPRMGPSKRSQESVAASTCAGPPIARRLHSRHGMPKSWRCSQWPCRRPPMWRVEQKTRGRGPHLPGLPAERSRSLSKRSGRSGRRSSMRSALAKSRDASRPGRKRR